MMNINDQSIIINDLLSFISCKIKSTSKEKLIKTLRRYYSEKDISEARTALLTSLTSNPVSDEWVSGDDPLFEIYNYFQSMPQNELPIFVCKDLNNVPDLDCVKREHHPEINIDLINDVDFESENFTAVEKTLREEQQTMKSQLADIVCIVKQLKDQLASISKQNHSSNSKIKVKRKEEQLQFRANKILKSNYCKKNNNSDFKRKDIKLFKNLFDEDEEKTVKEESEKENEADMQETINFLGLDYNEFESTSTSESKEDISCEVVKEEPEDFDFCFQVENDRENDNNIYLVSPSKSDTLGKYLCLDGSPSKTVSQKVIYIKNNEEQNGMEEEENTIEITSSSEFLGNLEDPLNTIQLKMSKEEDTFNGEIELLVCENDLLNMAEENSNALVCSICRQSFPSQKKLNLHVKSHCVKKLFDCILCEQGFTTKELLRSHYEQCLEITKKKYNLDSFPCPTCGRLYGQARALKQHSYMHSESRPFACNQCTYRYLTKNSLEAHMKTQHNSLNKYFCPFCDNSYISSGFLKSHIRSHTGERPFACKECDYKGATLDLLKRHMLTHGPPQQYKCDACEFTCLGIGKLSRHKAKEHKRENILCTRCGKEFNNSCVYHRHYMSHIGARPFPCSVCSYAAISKEVLLVHMRTHTGDNIVNCPNCSVPFGTNYSLKRHLKSYCLSNRTDYFVEVGTL